MLRGPSRAAAAPGFLGVLFLGAECPKNWKHASLASKETCLSSITLPVIT